MAQYYQIVGQGHSLTLEDLQRFCPNICLDGRIVVNQEDPQYAPQQVVVQQTDQPNDIIVSEGVQGQPQIVVGDGLQYQHQYIIRNDQPQPSLPPPPPQAIRPDFQQQQQQNHQQSTLHRHQVYYTSDLPVDAQVMLQQAPQIIDASLMQQSSTQRPQNMVNPVHVLSQPSVLHPGQQPPPQPPPTPQQQPSQQHTNQNQTQQQQQLSRTPQLLQQLQHQQQLQQFQQLQQQQQQLQHQLQQHNMQTHQIQHQQVVMQTAYINQSGTPARPVPPRLLNQALTAPSGVTLVRTPVRTVRPRRPPMRASLNANQPLQVPARLLNHNQLQQNQVGVGSTGGVRPTMSPGVCTAGVGNAVRNRVPRATSPRVLNTHAVHAQHRPPRPRTPIHQPAQAQLQQPQLQQQQQQLQQQQLTQHIIGHQVNQQQVQQLNQLKLSVQQQQILLNHQSQSHGSTARIITSQGTIVSQNMAQTNHTVAQTSQNNVSLPQPNTLNVQQSMSSQQIQQIQQVKKVVVQPNNANDMDDLEESITAAIVQKNIVNESMNSQQQYQSLSPRQGTVTPGPMNSGIQMNYSPQHNFQQQQIAYDNNPHMPQAQHQPQAVSQISQLLMEPENPEEKRQIITLPNGQRITVAEYRRIQSSRVMSQHLQQQLQQQQQQQQQPRDNGRQTLVKSKEQQRPVQRVPPMQTNQQTGQPENNEAISGPSEQASEPQSAKMLIFLQNGEQRLITFTLPKESCTLQEVLEQVEVPFTEDTHIQCMQNTNSEIDYFVSIGSTTRIEEMLENHPILVGDINTRNSPNVMSQQSRSSEVSTPEKGPCPDNLSNSPESPRSPPPRFVEGMLAVCKSCGYTGSDFSRCQRCRRVFTEEPKGVPIAIKKVEQKKKDQEKSNLEKPATCDSIKLNLLKSTIKTLNSKTIVQDKKPARVRKPRGKQPDPEPVILTLSSDEEDSNSSMLSYQEQSANMKEPSPSEIEGGTPDSGIGFDHLEGMLIYYLFNRAT